MKTFVPLTFFVLEVLVCEDFCSFYIFVLEVLVCEDICSSYIFVLEVLVCEDICSSYIFCLRQHSFFSSSIIKIYNNLWFVCFSLTI